MNATLAKSVIAFLSACMLLYGSALWFRRGKTVGSFLQLVGAGCLVLVVFTHVFEALHLMAWMNWGMEHSVGHYIDFVSAILVSRFFLLGTCSMR